MTADTAELDRLAQTAKALSDPIRLRMLAMLADGRDCCDLPDICTRNVPGSGTPAGICVCEFQEQFGLGQSRTSYHLKVLKDAGLVTEETRGKWTFYALDSEAARAAMQALEAAFEGRPPVPIAPSHSVGARGSVSRRARAPRESSAP